jgi:hypothetical protein
MKLGNHCSIHLSYGGLNLNYPVLSATSSLHVATGFVRGLPIARRLAVSSTLV